MTEWVLLLLIFVHGSNLEPLKVKVPYVTFEDCKESEKAFGVVIGKILQVPVITNCVKKPTDRRRIQS